MELSILIWKLANELEDILGDPRTLIPQFGEVPPQVLSKQMMKRKLCLRKCKINFRIGTGLLPLGFLTMSFTSIGGVDNKAPLFISG